MRSPTRSMISQLYARHVTSVSIASKHWTYRCRRSAIPAHLITLSLRLVNNTSSRKRLVTLSYHKLYIQCFTSRHHVISNKIHDLTTLCASCHECFDCIKTFTHHVVDLTIPATQHFITSSRITSMSSRKRHATLYVVTKLYTRIDRWSFRFLLSRLNRNFVSWTMCSSCHSNR